MRQRSLLPPRGIFIRTHMLFRVRMRAQLRETLFQLIGLAWGDCCTPILTVSHLAKLLHKPRQRVYQHLAELRDVYSALRLQKVDAGHLVIWLEDWLFDPMKSQPAYFTNRMRNSDFSEFYDDDNTHHQEDEDEDIFLPPPDDSVNVSGNPEI
jgi:hypothetical protein